MTHQVDQVRKGQRWRRMWRGKPIVLKVLAVHRFGSDAEVSVQVHHERRDVVRRMWESTLLRDYELVEGP